MSAEREACVESLVILIAMSAAGLVHAAWMRSRWSLRFAVPIDAGACFRGRRLFGDNKTLRGFMAIVPAAGTAFGVLGLLRDAGLRWLEPGLWGLDPVGLFALGLWAGFCFMAGELPNSFWKRRLGIGPGEAPSSGWRRKTCLALDRLDSTLAVLVGMALVVDLHTHTWLAVLLVGPWVHLAFSALLFLFGVKRRFA